MESELGEDGTRGISNSNKFEPCRGDTDDVVQGSLGPSDLLTITVQKSLHLPFDILPVDSKHISR